MKLKRVLIVIVSVASVLVIRSQTVPSNCTAKDSIVKIWKKSADKLAVRRSVYTGNTYKDSVAINKQLSSFYLKALLAVYNATALAARDTIMVAPIVADYYIPYDLNSIIVGGDSSKLWVKNLRDSVFPCGNQAIDQLLSKHYLKRVGYSYGYIFPFNLSITFSFRTDTNCFINRLCDKFNGLYQQGVTSSQPNNENRSDGFNITDSVNTNFTELTYSYGWGGCMIPCMYRRYWKFRVYNNCSVEYKGSYGQALPFNPFSALKDNGIKVPEIKFYPNPVSEKLKIESSVILNANINLFNSMGVWLKELKLNEGKAEMDLSHLANGIYFLQVLEGGKLVVNTKIIKE
jgi:hypothetical protein